MKLFKHGFTIAEMLICLAIISMVVAMVIPAAMSKKPSRNKAMFRKEYYNIERIVSELVNDESVFPSSKANDFAKANDPSTLFARFCPKNEAEVDIYNGGGKETVTRTKDVTGKYLCTQIASKLNIAGVVYCNESHEMPADGVKTSSTEPKQGVTDSPNFVTNDGAFWYMRVSPICSREVALDGTVSYRGEDTASTCTHPLKANGDLAVTSVDVVGDTVARDFICFQLDVNGNDKPNSRSVAEPDRFEVCIYYDGRMQVPIHDGKESDFLGSNNIID